jgi:hypothetical protein
MLQNLKITTPRVDNYGKVNVTTKQPKDFEYLIGKNINEIILFDNGSDALLESGATILPRYYFIFAGIKDGEIQFKPYEFNQYRIVVTTYKDIIMYIDSIG